MKIVTHSDMDGKCAGFLVYNYGKNVLGEKIENSDIFITNYDPDSIKALKLFMKNVEDGESVYITDYSIPIDMMDELLSKKCEVTWIDHHISAIERYQNYIGLSNIYGVRNIKYSGAMLTYMYLYKIEDVNEVPEFVRLVDDFDCWKHKMPHSRDFNECVFSLTKVFDPASIMWGYLMKDIDGSLLDMCIDVGSRVRALKRRSSLRFSTENRKEMIFGGYRCLGLRKDEGGNSQDLDFVDEDGKVHIASDDYDILLLGRRRGPGKFDYSIYSTKENIDVRVIAEKYGGGGHKGAAGFSYDKDLITSQTL